MNKFKYLLLIILSIILLCSCSSLKDNQSKDTSENQINKKYNAYVKINNFLYNDLNDSLGYYIKSFGIDKNNFDTDIKKSRVVSSVPDILFQQFEENYNLNSEEPVYENLDKIILDIKPTVSELVEILKDAESYYDSKDYIDDNFEHGVTLHNKICDLYNTYNKKLSELTKELAIICIDKQCEIDKENYKKNNQELKYNIIDYMQLTYKMCTGIDISIDSSTNTITVNKDKCDEIYEKLTNSINKISQLVNSSDTESLIDFNDSNFDDFIENCQLFKAAATTLVNSTDNISNENINDLVTYFSNMIFYYNRVIEFSRNIHDIHYFPII